jgi:amidase
LPGVAVPTGVRNNVPLGVQLVVGRFREDLCLDAAKLSKAAPGS